MLVIRLAIMVSILALCGCHIDANGIASYPGLSASPSSPLGVIAMDAGLIADGDFATGAGTDNGPVLNAYIAASTTGEIIIPAGCYKIATRVDIPSGFTVTGAGMWTTKLFCPTAYASDVIRLNGTGGAPTRLSNLSVLGQLGGAFGAIGIRSNANGTYMDHIWVNGVGAGIVIAGTDTFLSSFAIELCITGLSISTTDVNVTHGTLYGNADGCSIDNSGHGMSGPVVISGIRANASTMTGFNISNSNNVILDGCACTHPNAGAFQTAGFQLLGANDTVTLNACIGHLGGTPSTTASAIVISQSSSHVLVNACQFRGWLSGNN